MRYGISQANSAPDLTYYVNDAIREGWEPFGNLVVTEIHGCVLYIQPIIKHNISADDGKDHKNKSTVPAA